MNRVGPYDIIRTIGVGGMGEVFLASLERAGGFYKQVAVKRALPHLMADPDFVALFEREARLSAALTHRNIVQIFDFGRDDDALWLAMEFVHGVDLKAVLDAGPVPMGLALEIGIASARALAYAHRATGPRGVPLNLVHRDVSPHNLLLSFEGDVKLADFGLALPESRREAAVGRLQGKYAYMSPEQACGASADPRADLFALGVVLYEMLAGTRCFFCDDGTEAILARVRAARPLRPLAEAAPHLPPGLVQVVEQALAVDPEDRPQDGAHFADALRLAAMDAGVSIGVPALGPWLAEQFPAQASDFGVSVTETTVTAGAPIEATAAAIAPIALVPATEPTMRGHHLGVEQSGRVEWAADAPRIGPLDPVAGKGGRWGWVLVGLVLLLGGGAWFVMSAERAQPGPDAALEDATPHDAAPKDAARVERARDAVVDAHRPDAMAPDAAQPDAAAPDASVARPRRPVSAAPKRIRRPASRAPTSAAPASAPELVVPASTAPASVAPATTAPPRSPVSAALGPRLRARGPGLTLKGGTLGPRGWRGLGPSGVLLRTSGGGGPVVTVRIWARGGRFVATVASKPYGRVLLDGVDLGPTPAGAVPLRAGARVLAVQSDAGRTTLRVEVAP